MIINRFQILSVLGVLSLGITLGLFYWNLMNSESTIIQILGQVLFSIGAFFVPLQFYARRIVRRLNWPITPQTRLISIFTAYLLWLPAIFLCVGSPLLGELFPRGDVLLFQILVIDKTTFGWLFLAMLWLGIGFLFVEFKRSSFILKIGLTTVILIITGISLFWITKHQPVTCSQIKESELYSLIQQSTHNPLYLAEVEDWFDQSFFQDSTFEFIDYGFSPDFASWIHNDIEYLGNFQNNELVNIQVFWQSGKKVGLQPTLEEIMNCFGEPEFYRAWYFPEPQLELGFELWYIEDGIVVSTRKNYLYRLKSPAIDETLIMETLIFISPTDNVQVMEKNIYYGPLSEMPVVAKVPLKEWPDSNEQFEVSIITTN